MNLEQKIESILFWKAEPVKFSELAKILEVSEGEIKDAIESLKNSLSSRGLSLVEQENKIALVTNPENGELIEKLQKEDLIKDLSKATLETLSIILYRGPLKRSEIDYIRGVNSQFILRNLLVRGLIEKKSDPKDERAFIYKASLDLISYLGISKIEDLPDYESVNNDIEGFLNQEDKEKEDEVALKEANQETNNEHNESNQTE